MPDNTELADHPYDSGGECQVRGCKALHSCLRCSLPPEGHPKPAPASALEIPGFKEMLADVADAIKRQNEAAADRHFEANKEALTRAMYEAGGYFFSWDEVLPGPRKQFELSARALHREAFVAGIDSVWAEMEWQALRSMGTVVVPNNYPGAFRAAKGILKPEEEQADAGS